jgi:predicted deacylase
MQRHHYTAAGFLLMVLLVSVIAGIEFSAMYEPDTFTPSKGVTRIGKLSDYFDGIKGTSGDVDVYFFESGNPGATALLLGGTHPNESSGFITAAVVLENVTVSTGRLIVVPQACGSGFTSTDPLEGCPQHFTITTQSGERTFRYGARGGNPLDEWPAPLIYRHYPSGQQLSNKESRNLNRAYPGRADGSFTEQVGHAFMQLIRKENVDIGFDLHEAAPEIPIINAIVTHEKGKEIAATAVFSLEIEDLQYSLEISPKNFRGLSHREWGDSSHAYPFLMETSNPIQGRLRGETSEQLILEGNDKFYREAAQLGNVRITYDLNGETLSRRVARHLQGIRRLVEAFNEQFPENPVIIENMPEYEEVIAGGVGKFLR